MATTRVFMAVFPLNTVCGVYSVKCVNLVGKHITSFCCLCCFHSKIHILGSFQNIKVARNAICSLILGKLRDMCKWITHPWLLLVKDIVK